MLNAATGGPATFFYSASILITAVPWSWLWMHALRAGLVEGPREEIDRITSSFQFGWIPWLVTTLLALVAPMVAMAGIGLLTLYWMLFPGRHRRHR